MSSSSHGPLNFLYWIHMSIFGFNKHDYDYCRDMSIGVLFQLLCSYYLLRSSSTLESNYLQAIPNTQCTRGGLLNHTRYACVHDVRLKCEHMGSVDSRNLHSGKKSAAHDMHHGHLSNSDDRLNNSGSHLSEMNMSDYRQAVCCSGLLLQVHREHCTAGSNRQNQRNSRKTQSGNSFHRIHERHYCRSYQKTSDLSESENRRATQE